MSRLTLRNLGLLLITALLFVGLALLLSETLQPITPSDDQISPLQSASGNDTQQAQKFALRLDKTLLTPVTSTPSSTATSSSSALTPLTRRAIKLREPEFRKPLLFLAGALALGLISGIGFTRRAQIVSAAADQMHLNPQSESPPFDAPEKSELENDNRQLNAEVQSLRENLQSYLGVSEFAETLQLQQQETALENQQLNNQIEQLQSELKVSIDALDTATRLREQLEQTQLQNVELESKIQTLNKNLQEYAAATEDTEQLRKLQEKTSEQNGELLAEVQALRDKLHSYENEISNTEKRLRDREITIVELREELQTADGLASALQSTKQKQQELTDEISERDEIISNLHADIDNWRDQSASQEEDAIRINDELMLAREEKERTERDTKASEELIHELQQTKESLVRQIDYLEPRAALADDLGIQIGELEKSGQHLQDEHEHLQKTLLETQLVADQSILLQSRLTTLIEELAVAENAHAEAEQQIQSMQEQQRELESSSSNKDTQLAQLSTTITERDSSIGRLSKDVKSKQEQFDDIFETHQTLSIENQAVNDSNEELGREQQLLKKELKTLKTILEETEQNNIELSDSIILLREDLTDMANQVNERNTLINEGKKQLAAEMHHATAKEQIIDDLNAQLADEAQRIETMSESITHAAITEERLNSWDNSLQTFRSDISQKNSLIDQLHDAIRIDNIRTEALKDQIRSMDEQMELLSIVHEEVAGVTSKLGTMDELLGDQETILTAINLDTTAQYEKITNLNQNIEQMQQEKSQWYVRLEDSAKATAELQLELLDNQQTFLNLGRVLDQTLQSAEIENPANDTAQNEDIAVRLVKNTQLVSDHLSGSLNAIQITIDEHNILQSRFEEQVELNRLQRAESEKTEQLNTALSQEIENKQTIIDTQIGEHEADIELYTGQQLEFENKIDELSATLKSDQEAFATRQNELQQQIEQHIEREIAKDRDFGEQLLDKEQKVQLTSTSLAQEQEKTTEFTREIHDLNETLASERENSATRNQELQRLGELLATEKETFSAHQLDSEQQLVTLHSSQDELRLAHEQLQTGHQTEIEKLEHEIHALEAQIESNQNEHVQSLKTSSEQLRNELESQRDALMEKSQASHQQLTGELLEQKEANARLLKDIEVQREQIRQLKPTAQALPVLRNRVMGGSKVDHVPVLRQPKNKKD